MEGYRALSEQELEGTLQDLRRKLFDLRNFVGKLEKPHQLRETRKEIARVLTEKRRRVS